jgi:NAD(P)-dependent dehydrogenase (short-subunit alcohol dehydrogenase family)
MRRLIEASEARGYRQMIAVIGDSANLASIELHRAIGLQTRSAYAATKSGMIGLGRTWALELAPHGITVNMIAPGPIGGTEMFHPVRDIDSSSRYRFSPIRIKFKNSNKRLKRIRSGMISPNRNDF